MSGSTTHTAILQCTSLRGHSCPHKSSPSIARPTRPIETLASSRLTPSKKVFAVSLRLRVRSVFSSTMSSVFSRAQVRSANAVVPTIGRLSYLPARTWNLPRPGSLSSALRQFTRSCHGSSSLALAIPHTGPLSHSSVSTTSGLTSTPTRVLSPPSLITLHKPSSADAATLDSSFKKSLSNAKRILALANNNLFARFYVITPHKRIRPIFQPQRCTLTDPDAGIELEYLVGHSSNDPRFLKAEYTPLEVAGTYVCLVDTASADVPACYRSGPAFTAADITGTHALDLREGTTYKAVHLPLSLPIPYGVNDTAKGMVTESTMDILDTTVANGAFWARCLLAHDTARFDELVRCTADGIGKVANRLILPRLHSGQSWGQPSSCKLTPVGEDEEDEAKPAIDTLSARLLEISDLPTCSVIPPATVATSRGDLDDLDLAIIGNATLPVPRKTGATAPESIQKDTPLNERLRNRAKLANLGWDRIAESLHLPTLTENGEWLYCSPDRAGINEAMANMFANIPEAISQSTDFLHREVDLPRHDPLVYAQYASSYYEVSTMQSIELTGESKKRFRFFYLVPDSKSLAEERESASYDREAEELLGEAMTNLSKVNTTITMSTAINTVYHLRCTSRTSVLSSKPSLLATCPSRTSTRPPCSSSPGPSRCTSRRPPCALSEKSNQPHKPLVLWAVQMLDQLSILLTHPLRHTKNTYLLANDRIAEIATDKFVEAFELLDNCVSMLRKFECGTGTIPSCPLLQADEAKTTKSKLDKSAKRATSIDNAGTGLVTPDPKRLRTGRPGDSTPSADDLSGTRVHWVRHDADRQRATPLSASVQPVIVSWSALIDKTPALDWNGKVVEPAKVSARTARLSASTLSSATAGKLTKSYPRVRPAPSRPLATPAPVHQTAPVGKPPSQPTPQAPINRGHLSATPALCTRPRISSTKDMHHLEEFNKKYLGHQDFDPTAASLGKSFYDHYLSLSAVGNDTGNTDAPPRRPPVPSTLHRSSFGRPSTNHSFHQAACFETTYVLVLKSGYFEPTDILALHRCHPLLSHLLCACMHLHKHDFLWLSEYNLDWATQESLGTRKAYAFLACLLHYNLSVADVIQFLGNNYTGAYHNIAEIVVSLRTHGIAETLIADYSRVMTVGCPNHFNASTTRDNALLYWRKGNHPSIRAKLGQVMATMNKEERNNYVVYVPHWLWRFVPHCFITPQHILEKPGKKDRQIFDASRKYDWDSVPVNAMTSTPLGLELSCEFGAVCENILVRAYNLRLSYPNDDIVVHANDVKSCFRQIKHHPDVAGAFSYILADYLFFQIGLAFCADFSPANWEAVRRAQSALAERLFFDTSLVHKHRAVLDKIKWCRSLSGTKRTRFTQASCDALNQGVRDASGTPRPTPHGVYVDDDVYLDVADTCRLEQAIASSIEAIFLLLGDSDIARRQDPISWDKLHELHVAPVNRILGLTLNLRELTAGTPPDFVSATISLLRTTWGPHRRSFKAKEAEELTGSSITSHSAPWLKFLLGNIYVSIAGALRLNNSHLIRTSQRFRDALRIIRTAAASPSGVAKRAFHTGATARSVHGCPLLHHIGGELRRDLRLIERALSSSGCPTSCPIAYLIPRIPFGTARSDSSLSAAGGYCPEAKFWWYLEWPAEVRARTLKYITTRDNPALISINSLEYAAQLITMMGCHLHHLETRATRGDPNPLYRLECDNTAGESWLTRGCTSSATGRDLARLQAALLLDQGAGYRFRRVDTKTNVIADGISRIPCKTSQTHEFSLLLTQAPSLLGCRRFLPNADLTSSIVDVLLRTDCLDPLTASKQLLIDPGRFTSSLGATT
ncbi:hypothetical protein HJC23_004005 [Cyclotella cryptica]|uniref:Calmodulin n=1 Tax=Cyclotella cryptica TaxID=29204 RepID=A0ABD3QUG7_9STRA